MFAKRWDMSSTPRGRAALLVPALLAVATPATAQTRTFTSNADFDAGVFDHVDHDSAADQLQLEMSSQSFSFLWIPNSARGTLVRVDAATGAIAGEYRTAPLGRSRNPSRITIDPQGNGWTANRSEAAMGHGSVVKIGLVLGGTRVTRQADGTVVVDPLGAYVAPPYVLCTAVDRDGDGLIHTSTGLGNILPWPDVTDGEGGFDGLVQDAEDECILVYQRTSAPGATHVSLDPQGQLWAGAYPLGVFDVLNGVTGTIERSFPLGTGGFGGCVDANGVLWSSHPSHSLLLRYDTRSDAVLTIPIRQSSGLARDTNGWLWNSMGANNTITKLAADGTVQPGFPVPSFGGSPLGIAVGADGDVWVAHTGTNAISRLTATGALRKRITITGSPNGLCFDAAGRLWVTSQGQNAALRIDPAAGTDGLGAVDLTVALGGGAGPQSFGDMATCITVAIAAPAGQWSVIQDGGANGVTWNNILWNGLEPMNSHLAVAARSADDPAGLAQQPWFAVTNGPDRADLVGRFVEIQAAFTRGTVMGVSPVLQDLTVTGTLPPANHAPDCSSAHSGSEQIWPPDGRMVEVPILGIVDPDGDPVSITITGITQDEPVAADGHGFGFRRRPDGEGVGTPVARVRAERRTHGHGRNQGNGRVYAIAFQATDSHGESCTGQVFVCVPFNPRRAECRDDGQTFDSTSGRSRDCGPGRGGKLDARPSPNPFNPTTTLFYGLPADAHVRAAIYDVRGVLVRTLLDEPQTQGDHVLPWDGRDTMGRNVSSGVYLYHIQAGGLDARGRLVMMK